MGLLSGAGQGFAKGVNDMFTNYNAGAELSLQRMQEQRARELQNLQMMGLLQEQQAHELAVQKENGFIQDMKSLPPNATMEQKLAVQRKWYPGQGLLNDINYTKSVEANDIKENWYNARREMDEWRQKQGEKNLDIRERDLDRKERADLNKAVLAAIRANGSGKDTEFDKIYNSYVEQYVGEYKQGLHPNKPNPMARWEFKKYLDKKDSGIPDIPIVPPNPTNKISTWNPKTKKFE